MTNLVELVISMKLELWIQRPKELLYVAAIGKEYECNQTLACRSHLREP